MSGSDSTGNFRAKTEAIFRELAGERAARLGYRLDTQTVVAEALSGPSVQPERDEEDLPWPLGGAWAVSPEVARDLAFHLIDWGKDAAFLVALQLFPERFTKEEMAAGVGAFLIHAPNHVTAATVLLGRPSEDVFGLTDAPEKSGDPQ